MSEPKILTAQELGTYLATRPTTIRRWAKEGLIPSLRLPGGGVRFNFDEVIKSLESGAGSGSISVSRETYLGSLPKE